MPPFFEEPHFLDPALDGDALKELRDNTNHGHRVVVVDQSYPISQNANVLKYPGSTAECVRGIVELVPIEGPVIVMEVDKSLREDESQFAATLAIEGALNDMYEEGDPQDIDFKFIPRYPEEEKVGFYDTASNPSHPTTYFRTQDRLPFACAMFTIGHSQSTEQH